MKSSKSQLDAVDIQLLKLLQSDGRITNADLARTVKLSPPSVLQRVRRLEDSGFVKGYYAQLDGTKLGYTLTAFVQLSISLQTDKPIETVRKLTKEIPEVQEVHHISGDYDFLLKVVAEDMQDYERIIRDRLSAIPGISKIQSCFVMHSSKATTAFPL